MYRPGANTELGGFGLPDSFGVTAIDNGIRIVWHYRAVNERRTFTVSYRFRGLAVAYDDVVDVNLRVWGEHWPEGLGSLTVGDAPARHRASFRRPTVSGEVPPGCEAWWRGPPRRQRSGRRRFRPTSSSSSASSSRGAC